MAREICRVRNHDGSRGRGLRTNCSRHRRASKRLRLALAVGHEQPGLEKPAAFNFCSTWRASRRLKTNSGTLRALMAPSDAAVCPSIHDDSEFRGIARRFRGGEGQAKRSQRGELYRAGFRRCVTFRQDTLGQDRSLRRGDVPGRLVRLCRMLVRGALKTSDSSLHRWPRSAAHQCGDRGNDSALGAPGAKAVPRLIPQRQPLLPPE
jgi:hypothetical protein